jgi:hypothetical protein
MELLSSIVKKRERKSEWGTKKNEREKMICALLSSNWLKARKIGVL